HFFTFGAKTRAKSRGKGLKSMSRTKEIERINRLLLARGLNPADRTDLIAAYFDCDDVYRELRRTECSPKTARAVAGALTARRQAWKVLFSGGRGREEQRRMTELEKKQHECGVAEREWMTTEASQAWLAYFAAGGKRSGPEYDAMVTEHAEPHPYFDINPDSG